MKVPKKIITYSILLYSLLQAGIGDKHEAKSTVILTCFTSTAKGQGASSTFIDLSGASNIMFGNFVCDPNMMATAQQGKVGDYQIFSQLPKPLALGVISTPGSITYNKETKKWIAQGGLKESNISFPQDIAFKRNVVNDKQGVYISFQPTASEFNTPFLKELPTIELLIVRNNWSKEMLEAASKDLDVTVDPTTDALYSYYRRVQLPGQWSGGQWLEFGYAAMQIKDIPATFDLTVYKDGTIQIQHGTSVNEAYRLGIKNLVPINQK